MFSFVARLCALLTAIASAACSLPTLLQRNLAAIEASTATISSNSDVVKQSTSVSERGIKSFEDLRGPMESVAGLAPSLKEVAALAGPMNAVAKLDGPMKNVAGLGTP